ncbi:MAG TPA: efflux RND transporter periplasmic adaptor subunit, partial [Nitrospiraceae bacterium]|nr:efflux RND transporter periplasmic adaptor subunit [Nitrospiraceae bacterium]
QVSGMIESLHADFNSKVKAGQVVARIDPFPYRARRDQAEANLANANAAVAKARTDLAQRKREMDRTKALVGQQFVSQNEMDVALTAYEGAVAQLKLAEAAVKQAAAALESAELDLKYTVIRSPVDGVVISRQVEVGQRISANFSIPTLFLIAEDVTKMQVDTNVSEADIGGVSEGKEASFTVDAYPGELFHGKVRQVRNAPIAIQNVVTYDVVVEVENPNFRLKPGMTANVTIVVARRDDVLKIPNAALRFTPASVSRDTRPSSGKPAVSALSPSPTPSVAAMSDARVKPVWTLNAEGDPQSTAVQVGISDGLFTETAAGELREGDHVIVGIEVPRGDRKGSDLPPGFGSGQQRPSRRDRTL